MKSLVLLPVMLGSLLGMSSVYGKSERAVLLGVGQAVQSDDEIAGDLQTQGYTGVDVTSDDSATAGGIGYRHPLSHRWSLDLSYQKQGETQPRVVNLTTPPLTSNVQAAEDVAKAMPARGDGISALMVRHYSRGKSALSLQAGIGFFAWQSERTATVGGSSYTHKDEGVSAQTHLGLSYPIAPRVDLEGHWQHTFMPDEGLDKLAVGLAISF